MHITWFLSVFLLPFIFCKVHSNFADDDEFIEFDDDSVEKERLSSAFVLESVNDYEENAAPDTAVSSNEVQIESSWAAADDNGIPDEALNITERELNFVELKHPTLFNGYYWEVFFIASMIFYLVVYNYGRSACFDIASSWFESNHELLHENFALVGDTEEKSRRIQDVLTRESDSEFHIWNSGRINCDSLLIEMCLKRRQCLFHVIYNAILPNAHDDLIVFTVDFNSQSEIESFVFCMVNKRSATRRFRDFIDISTFCSDRSKAYKEEFVVFNEIPEVFHAICYDARLGAFISNYPGLLKAIHISDRFVGIKSSVEENLVPNAFPPRRVLIFEFVLKNDVPYVKLVLQFIDKLSSLRLSKESRLKAQRNRQRADEQQEKLTHQKRQDEAQQRKEERLRMETERILNETDPNKAKKLEDRQYKRKLKKRQSKSKQIIIRGM